MFGFTNYLDQFTPNHTSRLGVSQKTMQMADRRIAQVYDCHPMMVRAHVPYYDIWVKPCSLDTIAKGQFGLITPAECERQLNEFLIMCRDHHLKWMKTLNESRIRKHRRHFEHAHLSE